MKTLRKYTEQQLEILTSSFELDHETGHVFYKPLDRKFFRTDNAYHKYITVTVGTRAGKLVDEGYRVVYVHALKLQIKEHRLVYFLATGQLPVVIDHINSIKNDNRPDNLRSVTQKQNLKFHYERLDENKSHHSRKAKCIVSIDKATGQVVKEYKSVNEAGRDGFSVVTIAHCLAGRGKSSGGYIWKYAKDVEQAAA